MPADFRRLAQAISKLYEEQGIEPGKLGYTVNGAFRVVDPDNAKRFFVRFTSGTFVAAYHNGLVPQKPNFPVLVGQDNLGRPTIVGYDPALINGYLQGDDTGIVVGPHDHVRNSGRDYINDTWLLKQLRLEVVSGFVLKVRPGPYLWHRHLHWYNGDQIDLSGFQPTFGNQVWVVVGINPLSGTLVARAGAPFFHAGIPDSALIQEVPFVELGFIALGAIYLGGSDTQANNYQIEDLRFASGPLMSYLESLYDVESGYYGYSGYDGYLLGYSGGYWRPTLPADFTGGTGGTDTDPNAIHSNVSGEIHALTEKTTLANNDVVMIEDSAAGYVKKFVKVSNLPSVGGGFLTHSYVGYSSIGASNEAMVANTVYMKQITLATACLLASIEVYINSVVLNPAIVASMSCWLMSDISGAPGDVIGLGAMQSAAQFYPHHQIPRWLSMPVGAWLAAGTYWITVSAPVIGSGINLYYDSGSDQKSAQGGSSVWATDAGNYTITNSTRKYSLRASVVL